MLKTHEQFIEEIRKRNNFIDIIGVYTGSTNNVRAKCKRCGNEWEAKAYSLLQGRACPKCKTIRGIENNKGKTKKKTHNEFKQELYKINDSIELISDYISHHDYIMCKCKRCGNKWETKAYSLLHGHGCPRCSKSGTSFLEQFILLSFIEVLGKEEVFSRERKTIGMELDILIPKFKLAIEPGNWYLHKKYLQRDKMKRIKCIEKGIKLITIYDKFPKGETKPFDKDFIVFENDYNKVDHCEIRKLVRRLFDIVKIDYSFSDEQWLKIEKEAYENSKAKTHDDFVKEMQKSNPTVKILGRYYNASKRLLVKCTNCGYEWNAVPASLLAGDGCRKCGTIKAHEKFIKKQNEVIKELYKLNPNVEILGEYKGRHKKIKARCKICGYEWEPVVSSLLRGSSHKNSKSIHKNV